LVGIRLVRALEDSCPSWGKEEDEKNLEVVEVV